MQRFNMSFKIKVANTVFEIENKYRYVERLCGRFTVDCNEQAEFFVCATEQKMAEQKEKDALGSSDASIESTVIHTEIMQRLLQKGYVFIHTAVVELDGKSYCFLAESGVGKSTHISQWLKVFGNRAKVVNGDKPWCAFENGNLWAYGSPWCGKEGWTINGKSPVAGFCFLQRGEVNEIRKANQSEAISLLFKQVVIPKTAEELGIFMPIINRIITEVPCYVLKCNISEEAALVAYNGMKKE